MVLCASQLHPPFSFQHPNAIKHRCRTYSTFSDPAFSGKSASISDKAPDLSNIPKEYHDYADVFSKEKASKLAPHHPYDLKIDLVDGAVPPPSCTHSPQPNKKLFTNSLTKTFA